MRTAHLPAYFILILLVLAVFLIGCAPRAAQEGMPGEPREGPPEGMPCSIAPEEWHPQQGECPGTTSELKLKCDEFCVKHPDCCVKEEGESKFGGRSVMEIPSEEEISSLTRNYPSIIKAINEGPAIYGEGDYKVISDETFEKMKETGFNTIQMLTINDCTGEKCIMDEASKAVLLNDIVKAKQKGFAVWVALEFINAPPGSRKKLPDYDVFKPAYLELCREVGELLEQYLVEYFTVNNEPDLFLQEQAQWGAETEIDKYVAEMFVLANAAAKEKFKGKMINKITKVKARPQKTIDASFKNVDIASIDVGPPASEQMTLEGYKTDFKEYQFYASQAQAAGVPWMVGEYWASNFLEDASDYAKQNQKELAQVSFDAYLAVSPKGVGYSWNDFSTFALQPNGEATRLALKDFLNKIWGEK